MKNVDSPKRLTWVLVAGSLCAAGWLYVHATSSQGLELAAKGAAPAGDEVSSGTAGRTTRVSQRRETPSGVQQAPRPGRAMPSERNHPAMERAMEDDAEMAHYHWLAQKVLPTEEQRRMREDVLSDPELIDKTKLDLIASAETSFTREGEAKRMLKVEYLVDALAWEENPEIESVHEAIEDVLFAENISGETPDDLARSLAGDKMELYTQVSHFSPERASVIAERAKGKSVEPLLTYGKDWYDGEMLAMRADELP